MFGEKIPRDVWYVACRQPLVAEQDRLLKIIRANGIDYIFIDSTAVACDGPPEAAEVATAYFRALRYLGVGSLNVSHINRSENADKKPFGSSFWHNLARATWFVQRSEESDDPLGLTIGLFNRKANLGPIAPAVAFKFHFDRDYTTVNASDVRDTPDLAGHLALWQRVQSVLANGPMTTAAIASQLHAKENSIRQTLLRRPHLFARVNDAPDGVQRVKLAKAGRDMSHASPDTSRDRNE